MRYGPPFEFADRHDGRRLAYQVVGVPDAWQLHAVELATR
jgi:hypothetical protein